jgi:hypothetical protein
MHNFSGYNVTLFPSFNRLYSVSESEGAFSVVGSFTLGSREATVLTFSSGKSRNRQTQLPLTGLTWEPSWFNRLRDNCPGGAACPHRPHPCLKPHRGMGPVVDWTDYLQ